MVEMTVLKSREEWLVNRRKGLGGSDCSAVIGFNPYKSNVDLELPVNDVVNQGTQSMEYTDLENIVFKRM